MARKPQRPKLRKQPKRRVNSAVSMPQVSVPTTAKKRKKRARTQKIQFRMAPVQSMIFSSRWLSLLVLAVSIFAISTIARDQQYFLTYIPVEGTNAIRTEEGVARSGLAGRHIFAANPVSAAEQIGELPGVISTTVSLEWPNEVLIQIGEEAPIATWQQNDTEYWITPDGDLLPARTPAIGKLRIVSEVVEQPAVASAETDADALATETGAEAVAEEEGEISAEEAPANTFFVPDEVIDGALQLRELRPNIDQLYYSPNGGLSYQDGRGWRAYFGSGIDMHQKLVVYETLVEDLLARGITPTVISVSNQEKPYYRAQ